MDLPCASLEENRHIVKPSFARGVMAGVTLEAQAGHGIGVVNEQTSLTGKQQNQCRLNGTSSVEIVWKSGDPRGSFLVLKLGYCPVDRQRCFFRQQGVGFWRN